MTQRGNCRGVESGRQFRRKLLESYENLASLATLHCVARQVMPEVLDAARQPHRALSCSVKLPGVPTIADRDPSQNIMHASDFLSSAHVSLMSASSGGSGVTVDFDGRVLIQFVLFLLLFILIKPVLLDPFLKVIQEREKRTDGAKKDAREMDEKAGEIIRRYEGDLEKVRKVANEERERLRTDAQKLEAKILGEARSEATKTSEEGKAKIQKEAESIRFELGQLSATLSKEIASKVLGRELS